MAERNSLPKRPHETITDSLLHDGLPRDCRNIILRDIGRDPGLPMPPWPNGQSTRSYGTAGDTILQSRELR